MGSGPVPLLVPLCDGRESYRVAIGVNVGIQTIPQSNPIALD